MNRDEAYTVVDDWTKNPNLVKHMLAVEAIMRALAKHFGEEEEIWGISGLLHDADYELFKDSDPKKHPSKIFEEMEKRQADPRVVNAIRAHAWGWREDLPEPQTKMEWSLYCCDDLSGFIIACALVRPERTLTSLTIESLLKKWPQKSFAAGVNREHAELCQEKLGIPLPEFMQIALSALQGIHADLGL